MKAGGEMESVASGDILEEDDRHNNPDTALDMRISRAGHDEIPLARIEKRVRSESDSQTSRGRIENNLQRSTHKPVRVGASFSDCLDLQVIINFII